MSKTTEIHFVRHGETDWNATGRVQGQAESRLTDRGQAQARALGLQLDPSDFDAVYCSSSVRTRQTLDGLLRGRPCSAHFRDNLREIHLGPWQGLLRSDVAVQWPGEFEDFKHRPDRFALDGAESFEDLQVRGTRALDAIAESHAGCRVLAVSHGALIKAVYCERFRERNLCADGVLHSRWTATEGASRFLPSRAAGAVGIGGALPTSILATRQCCAQANPIRTISHRGKTLPCVADYAPH